MALSQIVISGNSTFPVRTANIFSDKVFDNFGALVQLVRIHACHAWGHEFESRTHRLQRDDFLGNHLFVCVCSA